MADLAGVLKELEQERTRLDQVIQVIGNLVGRNGTGIRIKTRRSKRTLSAAGRRKISLAQKARWAKTRRSVLAAAAGLIAAGALTTTIVKGATRVSERIHDFGVTRFTDASGTESPHAYRERQSCNCLHVPEPDLAVGVDGGRVLRAKRKRAGLCPALLLFLRT